MFIMHQKLRILQTNLLQWNHITFDNIFKDNEVIRKELETMQMYIMNNGYTEEIKVKRKINLSVN